MNVLRAVMSGRGAMSIRQAGIGLFLISLMGCSPITRDHGFVPFEDDMAAIVVGADTKLSVEEIVGRPSDTGLTEASSWYYVSSTIRTIAFLEPEVVERRVVVFDFDNNDVLQEVSEFGIENGRVINLQTRVTPTDARRLNLLQRLLGNIGAVTPPLPV